MQPNALGLRLIIRCCYTKIEEAFMERLTDDELAELVLDEVGVGLTTNPTSQTERLLRTAFMQFGRAVMDACDDK